MRIPWIALLSLSLLSLMACDEDDRPRGDSAPDTIVRASELDTPGRTVTFDWNGSDDGEVVAFEWRLSANGADGMVDVGDTLGVPWNRTEAVERTFSLDADLPGPPPGRDEDLFFQTYTFFVRAIDDLQQRDPTPAHASVTATTVAPTVRIRERIVRTTCSELSTGYGFSWEVDDPDAAPGDRLEVRWILVPIGGPEQACLTDLDYATLDPRPITADDPRWSAWVPYVEPGGEGGRHGEASLPEPVGSSYLFAVQARDAAGAVTPVFEWFENVMHFRTVEGRHPFLSVSGPEIAGIVDMGVSPLAWRRAVPAGFSLDFDARASVPYEVDAPFEYRWGLDVADPQNEQDPGWQTAWTSAPPHVEGLVLDVGAHTVDVTCRDRYGAVTSTRFGLDVLGVPDRASQRPLLVVDDTSEDELPELDSARDAIVASWLGGIGGFDAAHDVIDLASDGESLTMATLLDYRSIVWIVDPTGPRSVSLSGPGEGPSARTLGGGWLSMLELYQRHVGNVLVMGPGAMARALAPHLQNVTLPLEITNPPVEVWPVFASSFDPRREAGRLSYPSQAFGLQFLDHVGGRDRGVVGHRSDGVDPCDHIASVRAVPEALAAFGIDTAALDDWEPTAARLDAVESDPQSPPIPVIFDFEEIYDRPFGGRPLDDDPDVVALMRGVARRDRPGDPDCLAGDEASPNTGWPVALASRRFAKEHAPGPDVVVGLDPFGFAADDVRAFVEAVVFDLWEAAER